VVPSDAVYIIETNNSTKGWKTLSESNIWKHLITSPKFADINKSASTLDSLINNNSTLDMLMSERQLLISAHMTEGNNYDFLFVLDLKKGSKITFIKDYLKSILAYYNYNMEKADMLGQDVTVLTDQLSGKKIYLAFIENLMVCSFNEGIMRNSIKANNKDFWAKNASFSLVKDEISGGSLFNIYFNFTQVSPFLRCYMNEESPLTNSLAQSLIYSAFNINLENDRFSLKGAVGINDSLPSYIKAMASISPGKMTAFDVISSSAALYLSIGFSDYFDLQDKLINIYSSDKSDDYESYNGTLQKIEKYLKIDLKEDFGKWIGSEIALVKMPPTANAREDDMIAVINANSIDNAKKGMEHIEKQCRKKLPIKFNIVNYQNYEIHYVEIKGLFKLFFGKLFAKLEKPYFTYIDDNVIFSNSPSALMDIIDDYIKGNTLAKNKSFMDFKDQFDSKANITAFIQMPKLYSHLFYYSNPAKKDGIHSNKDLIISFEKIGFQLVSDGKYFKTTLIGQHNPDAFKDATLEEFEKDADQTYNKEIELLTFKPQLPPQTLLNDGPFKFTAPDSNSTFEGRIKDNKIDGLVREYYRDGKIKSSVNYKDGIATGSAIFYYDNEKSTVKAKVNFEKDKITDKYNEFYQNGERKAMIEYDDGVPHGDCEYYYDSGVLKIEGGFKKGVKNGKWKHYSEAGNLIDKEKYKKGELK
ncbi:MAG: toxin-antitoxin system YwqK family antitoxin, partial [Bacteroidota bacterium]